MTKPRVFLLEQTKFDADFRQFGEVVFMYGQGERVTMWAEEYGDLVAVRFARMGFDPSRDFFCISGAVVPVMLTLCALSGMYDEFTVLVFDRIQSKYRSRKVCTPCVKSS